MSVEIKKVTTRKDLKRFIRFNYEFYKDNPFSVPDLYDDMLGTFSSDRNAAFEFCEADYFLACRDGRIVGRVAAIINRRANETWGRNDKSVLFHRLSELNGREEVLDYFLDYLPDERNHERAEYMTLIYAIWVTKGIQDPRLERVWVSGFSRITGRVIS